MDPIKSVVASIMGQMSSGTATCQQVQGAWEKISSDKQSKVVDLKNGCVTVAARTSMHLVKLNLNRENLLKELQKEIPSIQKISFKVGN